MTPRSTRAADMRAAQAALARQITSLDRYLVIDDCDDDVTQIVSVMRECSRLGLEVAS